MNCRDLLLQLNQAHALSAAQYRFLLDARTAEDEAFAKTLAVRVRKQMYGDAVFVRGLIEISNFCKNDCYYCGIRRGNKEAERYRLTPEQIMECAAEGYRLGFRTFVLQGGEDPFYTDEVLCALIKELKARYPECAVTLSLGERSRESFAALKDAGADRYLLRHETADPAHYARLHPPEMSFENRIRCLRDLKEIGFQTGCGFMVGSPGQTPETLAADLAFIETFRPEMCGIGPFIPHRHTPLGREPAGSVGLTLFLLSVLRLMLPEVLLPATTALGTLDPEGREKGILAGANVVMPNLSPAAVRKKYELYDHKLCTGCEAAEGLAELKTRLGRIGCETATGRGDAPGWHRKNDEQNNRQREETNSHGNL